MRELQLIRYSILKDLPHCFTTRVGGVSEGAQKSLNLSFARESSQSNVQENYRRAANALGVEFEKMTRVPQVHGDGVLTVTEREAGMGIARPLPAEVLEHGYDAMITDVPRITLCTLHADCVPVLLYDPEHRAVGAVHSGWRGTVQKITAKTIRQMERCYGTRPEALQAVIGPSIGIAHFETDEDVYLAFRDAFGEKAEDTRLIYRKEEKYHISVSGFVHETLLNSGVITEHIAYDDHCTFEEEARFFSHRRDHGNTGAMCAMIALGDRI